MDCGLKGRVDTFCKNVKELEKVMLWDDRCTRMLCAILCAHEKKKVDLEKIKDMKKIIKKRTTFFSNFRGSSMPVLATILSLERKPIKVFENSKIVYEKMKNIGFIPSNYLTLASVQIAKSVKVEEYDETVSRMRFFYNSMTDIDSYKDGTQDYLYAAMFAVSAISKDGFFERLMKMKSLLKDLLGADEEVQILSYVLMLAKDEKYDKENSEKTYKLSELMKEKKYSLRANNMIAALGFLVSNGCSDKNIDEVLKCEKYLKSKNGFGPFFMDKNVRLLFVIGLSGIKPKNLIMAYEAITMSVTADIVTAAVNA